jgi:hypothetical protein
LSFVRSGRWISSKGGIRRRKAGRREKQGGGREQGGKRTRGDVLGWGDSEVGLGANSYTWLQEGDKVCVQEGMLKKRKNGVFAYRACLKCGNGDGMGMGMGSQRS